MCGYICIRFIDYILADPTLIDYTGLFSPYNFKKNDKMISTISNSNKLFTFVKIISQYKNG